MSMPTTSSNNSSSNESRERFPENPALDRPGQRLRIIHRTVYTYGEPANRSSNQLRLCPRDSPWQQLRFFLLTVRPTAPLQHFEDLNRNTVHRFEIAENHSNLFIESHSVVERWSKIDVEAFPYGCSHDELAACRRMERCHDFLQGSRYVLLDSEIWRAALDAQDGSTDVFQTGYQIMQYVYENFRYDPGATQVSTNSGEAFQHRHGVCQDFSHVCIAMCRSLGIPARYVSGYLFDPDHDKLRGTQASHAWFEIFIPEKGGWYGLDPTNNKVMNRDYITVAVGRDYADVSPVEGDFYGGGAHRQLEVSVDVQREA
ncbi:MAG: transglutaminase family protein [Verrucomicrobiales bacterium]|nr:transglutaminase family protein [Verrucomicrobiales bacterium]